MLQRNQFAAGSCVRRPRWRRFTAVWLCAFFAALPSLLLAQGDLSGVVFERRGAGFVPLAGAWVEVRLAGGGEVLYRVETGSMGRYFLSGLPAGEVAVTVTHPRYYMAADPDAGRTVRCTNSAGCGAADFEMLPAGELELLVVDSLGMPVEEAAVQLRRLGGPGRALTPSLRTAAGLFRASGMHPGRYRAEAGPVERRGIVYHRAGLEFDYSRGAETQRVRLVMSSERLYRVAGRIVGMDASEARAVLVLLEPEEPETAVQRRLGAPVDAGGHFAVNGVPGGAYSARLIWEEASRLDLMRGPSRYLGRVAVADDVADLLFSKPPDTDSR